MQIKDDQKHGNQVTSAGYIMCPYYTSDSWIFGILYLFVTLVSFISGELPAMQCALRMPEKRILELILDVLQRWLIF